jgi:hypothetical protein
MKQDMCINNKDFFDCIFKNEIDLIILWIKFFKTMESDDKSFVVDILRKNESKYLKDKNYQY